MSIKDPFEKTKIAMANYAKAKEKAQSVPHGTFKMIDATNPRVGHLAPWEIEITEPLPGETPLEAVDRIFKAAVGVRN